jgi:hypothetical protein
MWNKENWFDELNENQIRNRLLLCLVLAGIFIFVFRKDIVKNFNWYEQNKEWVKDDYEKGYCGTVVRKGRDRSNHNFAYFQLKDSTKIFDDEVKIWSIISIGDSVFKKKKSKILLIIKKDKVVKISYDDIFKYRDSLMRNGKY